MAVDLSQMSGNPIMFSHKNRVNYSETQILVNTEMIWKVGLLLQLS